MLQKASFLTHFQKGGDYFLHATRRFSPRRALWILGVSLTLYALPYLFMTVGAAVVTCSSGTPYSHHPLRLLLCNCFGLLAAFLIGYGVYRVMTAFIMRFVREREAYREGIRTESRRHK